MNKRLAVGILLFCAVAVFALPLEANVDKALHKEIAEVCSKVRVVESLTDEELNELVAHCEDILERLEGSDVKRKKVYKFKVEKCLKLYKFMLGKNAETQ